MAVLVVMGGAGPLIGAHGGVMTWWYAPYHVPVPMVKTLLGTAPLGVDGGE